jgi:integrase
MYAPEHLGITSGRPDNICLLDDLWDLVLRQRQAARGARAGDGGLRDLHRCRQGNQTRLLVPVDFRVLLRILNSRASNDQHPRAQGFETRATGTVRIGWLSGDFRKAWETACKETGVAGLHFHDLRRSAARNMDRTGRVSSAVAMKITGHATDSMWRRYRIVDEDDVERALTVIQEYVSRQAAAKREPKTVAMSERRS